MGLWDGGLKKKITVLKRRKMQRKGFSQVCFPVHWYIVEAVVARVQRPLGFRSFSLWNSLIALLHSCYFMDRFMLVLISSWC